MRYAYAFRLTPKQPMSSYQVTVDAGFSILDEEDMEDPEATTLLSVC
jgi:hypothetical protein